MEDCNTSVRLKLCGVNSLRSYHQVLLPPVTFSHLQALNLPFGPTVTRMLPFIMSLPRSNSFVFVEIILYSESKNTQHSRFSHYQVSCVNVHYSFGIRLL